MKVGVIKTALMILVLLISVLGFGDIKLLGYAAIVLIGLLLFNLLLGHSILCSARRTALSILDFFGSPA